MAPAVHRGLAVQHLRPSSRERGYTWGWEKARAHYLREHPLCRYCLRDNRIIRATTVDHITPHKGDDYLFWDRGNWQALCTMHHNKHKQQEERGTIQVVGEDGWPAEEFKRWGYSIPGGTKPSAIPVILVCGPPASGKSTYVATHKADGDKVIDLDECKVKVGGVPWDTRGEIFHKAIAYRDAMIRGLKDKHSGKAWLIVAAPALAERKE